MNKNNDINPDEPLTDEEWESLGPAMSTDALPAEAQAAIAQSSSRGRPKLANPKESITIRLDADIVQALRSTGKGWQSRMNMILKEWVDNRPS